MNDTIFWMGVGAVATLALLSFTRRFRRFLFLWARYVIFFLVIATGTTIGWRAYRGEDLSVVTGDVFDGITQMRTDAIATVVVALVIGGVIAWKHD